ncbi:HPP family protein [Marinicrinis sediminis]|uniref:HPP family protein n=1 Tax=Marinicrinis sediminis TaxID=1652465 RepID=A0ABW5R5G9_9BACL
MSKRMPAYTRKMFTSARTPLKVVPIQACMGFIGGFAAIGLLGWLTNSSPGVWLMAPFGASCVLVFIAWEAPLSQPRNVVGGHLISSAIGLLFVQFQAVHEGWMALAVGLAIAAMHLTKTTHPPAGADPLVVMAIGSSWSYLLFPVLAGSLLIVLLAVIMNNLHPDRKYPSFWL